MSIQAYVERYFREATPAGQIVSVSDLSVHERRVVCCVCIAPAVGDEPRRQVATLELDTGELLLAPGNVETSLPRRSADGSRIAYVAARSAGSSVVVADLQLQPLHTLEVDGYPEYLRWSTDGTLLLGVAEPGAQRSDVDGSGVLASSLDRPSWAPIVDDGQPQAGRRRVWLWDGQAPALSMPALPSELNLWRADWCGPGRVIAIVSDAPTESDWYTARLVRIDVRTGAVEVLPTPGVQLAHPAADPSGRHVSVIAGLMSDRGIDTGTLVVDGTAVDCDGVDVTDHCWINEHELVFAGQRGLHSVVGRYRPDSSTVSVLWESSVACGQYCPEVGASSDAVVVWAHEYGHPPRLLELTDGVEQIRLAPTGFPDPVGTASSFLWTSPDGTSIEGVLVTPDGPGPHPLIVHVHGGPVWCWRDEWSMHYPFTPLFVGRGYAVLHPNHRSSSGRGQDFIAAGLRAMGGPDAEDIVSGVDALVARGIADPNRVAVTGNSYGGFMAAWLAATSDRFCAASPRSPVTDWVSQHLTSNLPGFDDLCLDGELFDPASDYVRRSPLRLADGVRIPVLLMAGAHDLATPASQALMMHRALIERGRPSTLIIYPEEGHGVRARPAVIDQCVRLLDFFDEACAVRL